MRSRVIPGSLVTIERRVPVSRLKIVDLPTLGRPTITTEGSFSVIFSVHWGHCEPKREARKLLVYPPGRGNRSVAAHRIVLRVCFGSVFRANDTPGEIATLAKSLKSNTRKALHIYSSVANSRKNQIESFAVARGHHYILWAVEREGTRITLQFWNSLFPKRSGPHDHNNGPRAIGQTH